MTQNRLPAGVAIAVGLYVDGPTIVELARIVLVLETDGDPRSVEVYPRFQPLFTKEEGRRMDPLVQDWFLELARERLQREAGSMKGGG